MNSISIVIPVYNEATRLADCLDSIANQVELPFEVIVVDNNSTDDTAAVARRYPFVRLITEKKQGVVYARNRGFDEVRGTIIGRIDADTHLAEDWTLQVAKAFRHTKTAAITGSICYYDMPNQALTGAVDLVFRRRIARQMGDKRFLQGANMALRRSAWQRVRCSVCNRGGMHEDFDLAIHLQQAGRSVRFDPDVEASISARCIDDSLKSFWQYAMLNPRTYEQHGLHAGRYMYPLVILALIFYAPLRIVYRGYDATTGHFSWKKLMRVSAERVNPATYGD